MEKSHSFAVKASNATMLYLKLKSVKQVCEATGHAKGTIRKYLHYFGITNLRQKTPTDLDQKISDLYLSGLSLQEVADVIGTTFSSINWRLKRHGTKLRPNKKVNSEINKKILDLYSQGHNANEISESLPISSTSVKNCLDRNGVKTRGVQEAAALAVEKGRMKSGKDSHRWKGGRHKTKQGYILTYTGRRKSRFEHDLVVEGSIGRRLKPGEVVHHKNRIRDDNRLENLQLMTISEHMSLHNKGIPKTKKKEIQEAS